MFPEEPGDEVPFGETVCEIVSDLGKNYADQGFFKGYDEAEFLWTRLMTDVTDADACMAKIGSTAEWAGLNVRITSHPVLLLSARSRLYRRFR